MLFSVIYKVCRRIQSGDPQDQKIQEEINYFLLSDSEKGQLRVELNEADNPFDKKNFEQNILVNLGRTFKNMEGRDNISKVNRYFSKYINTRNYYDIYQTIANNFYFSLMIIDKDADTGELFMALNKAVLDLTVADLVKSLFVTRETDPDKRQETAKR